MFEQESAIQTIIETLSKDEKNLKILSEVKSGKEATVFLVELDGHNLAMKLYNENDNLKSKNEYLQNKFYKTKSHFRAAKTKSKFGKDLIFSNWIKREFTIINKLFELGASVPKPKLQIENAIFMEYIGDLQKPAPRLKDVVLTTDQAHDALQVILRNIEIFLDFKIIHGDLSAYNILWWQEKIWIIDFPQAIDLRGKEDQENFLVRDLQNLVEYFKQYFPITLEELIEKLAGNPRQDFDIN